MEQVNHPYTLYTLFPVLLQLSIITYFLLYWQIERNSRNGFFMNPWEAKEYGLVDEVIDDGKPGLVAPLADSSAPPFPGEWFLWRSGCVDRKILTEEDLPSEEKMSQNGKIGGSGADEV